MRVRCEKCQAEYNIDDARVPAEGLQIKCPRCSATFIVAKAGGIETAGQLFDFGEVKITDSPSKEESLELDLPEEMPAKPPAGPSRGQAAPRGSGSTLPPIGGATKSVPMPQPPASSKGGSSLPGIPSKPTPPAPTPGSEGEIFDFIDHGIGAEPDAEEAGGEKRFRIRRKSGKVFGPFDSDTVNRMLAEHQLMGNEEASSDGLVFKPLGSFDDFGATIRALMDEPVISAPTVPGAGTVEGLDEDEEAVIAPKGLEFAEPPAEQAKKSSRTPLYALIAVVGLVLLVGLGLGFTRFGFFGIRLFTGQPTPPVDAGGGGKQPGQNEPEAGTASSKARMNFFQDTFAGYRAVTDELEAGLKAGEDSIENQYLLALSYAALLRNYGANDQYLRRARELYGKLKDQAASAPETKKVGAAVDILSDPAKAISGLDPLLTEDSHDREALFLAGWAMAYQKKWTEAARFFDRATVLDPDFTKAYHALGDLQSLQGDFESALQFYQKALEKNPRHINSAVELARIYIEVRSEDAEGEKLLTQVFGKYFQELAPSEQAKANYLRARINMRHHDNEKAVQDLSAAIELVPTRGDYIAALGNFFLDLGEYAKALVMFDKALAIDAKNIDAMVGKGRASWQNGDIVKAKLMLEETAKQAKDDPRPLYFLGRIAEDLDKPGDAMKLYEEANKLAPQFLLVRVSMARLQLKQGQMKEALAQLTEAARANPRSAIVHNGLGEVYLTQKNLHLAEEEFRQALQLDPELPSGHFNLANVLREDAKYDQAASEYEKVLTISPKYPDLAYEYGYCLFMAKKYPEALKMYEKAILANPKDDRLYVRAGTVADAAGDLPTAIKYFQTATAINNTNSEAFFRLALVFQRQGNHDQAMELFKRAAEMDKDNAEVHYNIGLSLLSTDQAMDAIEEFRLTIKLKPAHIDALMALGKALAERAQFDEAIKCFEKVAKEQPNRVELLLSLGDAYSRQGLFQKALGAYQKAYNKEPSAKGVAYRLGRTFDDLSKKTSAIKFYQLAIKADPKDPMPHFYLGHVYKSASNNKLALAEFRKYLQLRPDAPDADEVKDEIDYLKSE